MQQGQASKRVVAEGLNRLQSDPAMVGEACPGARPENPLGVFGARTVEARRQVSRSRSESRGGSSLPPDVAEKLATGAQGNALQHLCPCSAQASLAMTESASPMHSDSASATQRRREVACCSTLFSPTRSWQKWCSDKCRTAYHSSMSPEALRKDIAALQRQIASVEDMRREVAAMREELRKVNRDADRRDEAAQG